MKQLTENVFGLLTLSGFLNGYLIRNNDKFTLVDTGVSAGFIQTANKGLMSIGKSLADVHILYITHAHPDHIGGVSAFQKQSNAPLYIHEADAGVIEGRAPLGYPNPAELGAFGRFMLKQMQNTKLPVNRVGRALKDGEILNDVFPDTQVIHLPGHSYGQAGLYLPSEGTLIGGDVLMHFPWGMTMPIRPASPDWNAVKQSIRKVADLNPRNLLLGHGQPYLGNAGSVVKAFIPKMK